MRGMVFNCHGLKGKETEIANFICDKQIDFSILVETWHERSPQTTGGILSKYIIEQVNFKSLTGYRRGVMIIAHPQLTQQFIMIKKNTQKQYIIMKYENTVIVAIYNAPDTRTSDFIATMEEIRLEVSEHPFIIIGDFNARIMHNQLDTQYNEMGRSLESWTELTGIQVSLPVEGRFTYYSYSAANQSKSVLDLVLTHQVPIEYHKVHDHESLGGSDHRPITFNIPSEHRKKRFFRWNLKKFINLDIRAKYSEKTEASLHGLISVYNNEQNIDVCWKFTKKWINRAAQQNCGRIEYNNFIFHFGNQAELKEKTLALNSATNAIASVPNITNFETFATARKEYKDKVLELNQQARNQIAIEYSRNNNSSALSKLISNRKGQVTKAHCCLRPSEMDKHENYFKENFGVCPPNQVENIVITIQEYVALQTNTDLIQKLINKTKVGTSPGIDGISGELIKYAKGGAKALAELFNKIQISCTIPDEWKLSLIVPIYKKKGDKYLAQNHRPIALTILSRRIFEKTVAMELERSLDKLSEFQGGFRKDRSTMMQIFTLHEIIVSRKPIVVVLDLKSAYDRVNREFLWNSMLKNYDVGPSTIKRLQMLFDDNASILLINGKRGRPIQNRRGLLQGSSLSPTLFNFFIDSLLQKLNANRTNNVIIPETNVLAFADDLVLIAKTNDHMKQLLRICIEWADQVGMEFAPSKCFHLGNTNNDTSIFQIKNQALKSCTTITYLGIPFTNKGIELKQNILNRTKHVQSLTGLIGSLGMHGTGFSTQAALRIYKTFIRPTLEYGLQLKIVDKETINILEKAQVDALRTIFSASMNTSIGALHKLSCMESMELRNQILNMNFMGRIHHIDNDQIPAHSRWKYGWANLNEIPHASLIKQFYQDNMILHHLGNIPNTISDLDKKAIVLAELNNRDCDTNPPNVSSSITVDKNLELRGCFQEDVITDRKTRILINLWLTGRVAVHQQCRKSNEIVTRKHAIECSNIIEQLNRIHPDFTVNSSSRYNALDQAFQFFYSSKESEIYSKIAACIQKIYIECLGYKQKENDYWERATDPDNNLSTTTTSTNNTNRRRRIIPMEEENNISNSIENRARKRPKNNLYSVSEKSRAPNISKYLQVETPEITNTSGTLPPIDARRQYSGRALRAIRTLFQEIPPVRTTFAYSRSPRQDISIFHRNPINRISRTINQTQRISNLRHVWIDQNTSYVHRNTTQQRTNWIWITDPIQQRIFNPP